MCQVGGGYISLPKLDREDGVAIMEGSLDEIRDKAQALMQVRLAAIYAGSGAIFGAEC